MLKNTTEKCFYDTLPYHVNYFTKFNCQNQGIIINGTTKCLYGTAKCLSKNMGPAKCPCEKYGIYYKLSTPSKSPIMIYY